MKNINESLGSPNNMIHKNNMQMEAIATMAKYIIQYKKSIVVIFIVIAIICTVLQFFVAVNYKMTDYLPNDAPSTKTLQLMNEQFDDAMVNTQVMIKDVNVQEALSMKEKMSVINGVSSIIWLDDIIDLTVPLAFYEADIVETYYKDRHALFSFAIKSGEEVPVTDALYELIGEDNAIIGEALATATQQKMAFSETMLAASLLIPIIIIILIISTNSWMEPVFFLTAIGVSIVINLGTNIFIGEISFVTQSVAPILQLAVSLDYAIFLLHSFSDYRKAGESPEQAMHHAIKRSFPAIAASASTTFFGFIALSFMQFEIGSDLGFNLVKGILLSFITVIVFLPALTLVLYKWIDKTRHKQFIPPFKRIGSFVMKVKFPALIIVAIVIVPAFLAQSKTDFIYGIGDQAETSRPGIDEARVHDVFGKQSEIVLLLPKGHIAREQLLINDLKELPFTKTVVGYAENVSPLIPAPFLEEKELSSFFSEEFSRIIVYTSLGAEGEVTFAAIDDIYEVTGKYYETYHPLGESVTLYDIKNVVQKDNKLVNILTVATIALVLLITFRSISLPVVLLLTIQSSVWINLSVPYFTDVSLVFVGYLIVSTVQLAATVDYAILLTVEYLAHRKKMGPVQAIIKTINEKVFAILISASILSSVGFILAISSSNQIVASIGLLLGRGALLAFLMVLFLLPAILVVFDKWIEKTTWRPRFWTKPKQLKEER